MSVLTLPHTNGSHSHRPAEWLQLSVQKFFTAINWEDRPIEIQEVKLSTLESAFAGTPTEMSLTLKVGQFFGAIDWEGNAIAQAPSVEPILPEKTDNDLTLDDFSSLF